MTHWSFHPILGNYVVVALSVTGLLLLLFLRPTFRRLSRGRRWVLLAIRGLVIALLLLGLLRPTVVATAKKHQSSLLLVLLDASRSMTLPSATEGRSRWDSQSESIRRAMAELADESDEFEVRVYAYDSRLRPLEYKGGRIGFPEKPDGDQTDIGSSLYDATRQALGKRLAGVLLLGDGTQTAITPQVEVSQSGRELARLNCPLYTVAFGPPGDVAQARDVAIDNLPEQYSVFVKNELIVRGVLRVRGYVNQEVPVELALEDSQGNKRSVGTKRLIAREDGQQLAVDIAFIPQLPGRYKLTMRANEQPGELVTKNNELSSFVTVLEGGLRTLYLYGDLLGEQRLLRRAINASPDIQLDDVFIDPRNRSEWPVNISEYLVRPSFDVLMLESVDASALSELTQREMLQAIESGRGFMMIGGFHSFGAGGYFGKPLADLLPIEMDRFERQDFGLERDIIRDLHLWGELEMVPVRPHPVTRLASDSTNVEAWKSLPKLRGANLIRDVKPRAQVLAQTPDGTPLLIAGEYGRGRVLAFAANSSYRWWQSGRVNEYRRFWRQAILWLAQRDEDQRNDVWVRLAQRRFAAGSRVSFQAGAKSPSGDPISGATFTAELVSPSGTRKTIPLSTSGEEVVGSLDETAQPGDYAIEVAVAVNGQPVGRGQASFQVLDQDIELSNPAADHDLLARLALQTNDAGGRPVSSEELPQLMREIKQRHEESVFEIQTKWQLGDTALDAWLFLLTFVAALTAEWALRKKWGLV